MNCRERVLRAITFDYPDRIPVTYSVGPRALWKYGEDLIELCRAYPSDFFDVDEVIKIPKRDTAHRREDGSYYKKITDAWGCEIECYQEGISGEVKRSPLEDWSALSGYTIPPLPEPPEIRDPNAEMPYVAWGGFGSLYEQMQWLRGVENLMFDVGEEREELFTLADRLLDDYIMPLVERELQAGADIIGFNDDWGTQTSLLISPTSWRKIFKPRYKRIFDRIHEGGALVWMHSDGMILEIVPDLIEIGVNVLNPQCNCMDLDALAEIARGRLCLAPDIDRQHLLPNGTPEEVRDYIRRIHDMFAGPNGGLIYTVGIYDDMPMANIEALLQAFREFGCPLESPADDSRRGREWQQDTNHIVPRGGLMTPRENLISVLKRTGGECIPFTMCLTAQKLREFEERTGTRDIESYYGFPFRGVDCQPTRIKRDWSRFYEGRPLKKGTIINDYGCAAEPSDEHEHLRYHVAPIPGDHITLKDVETFPFDDREADYRFEGVAEQARAIHARDLASFAQVGCLFELAWHIRGMEDFMMDFYQSPEMAHCLLERIMAQNIVVASRFAEAGVDIVAFADDVGSQNGMLISPGVWREFIKPRFAAQIKAAKDVNPDVIIWYHNDGKSEEIIPELIEIGVDVLQPIQPECYDPVELKNAYGARLSFWGTIGTQHTLPFGTPEDVRQEVKRMAEGVGYNGGLVISPAHNVQPHVPWENIDAFVDACREFGRIGKGRD